MRKFLTLTAAAAIALALVFLGGESSLAQGKGKDIDRGFGKLVGAPGGFLPDHYDNRTGQVVGDPEAFIDSMEVNFEGEIEKVCDECTVVQSASWTFTSFLPTSPCATVYIVPKTLVRIHTHQGVSTENVSGPLTLIPGSAVNDPGGPTEFPFSAAGVGANGLVVGTHTFTATITITDEDGNFMTGAIEGGSNCEVEAFPGNHTAGVYDFDHTDTNNTVCTAFEITGVSGDIGGAVLDTGELCYTYDTLEPHNLLSAHIQIDQ